MSPLFGLHVGNEGYNKHHRDSAASRVWPRFASGAPKIAMPGPAWGHAGAWFHL